jgi:AAA ATPase domain
MADSQRKNPFTPHNPIRPQYFAGRYSEIQIILRALSQTGAGSQQNILVTGERGIGKSSLGHLARYIGEQPREEWDTQCRFITAYYILDDNDSVAAFCRGLVEKLRKSVAQSLVRSLLHKLKELDYSIKVDFWFGAAEVGTKTEKGEDGPAKLRRDFVRIIEALWDEVSNENYNGILLIVDELNKIQRGENLGAFFKKVSEELVADGYRNIMFFVLGLPWIEGKLSADDASVVRIFEHVELGLMPENESEEVIRKALEGTGVGIEPQVLEMLKDWSEGHPYFLQQMCFDCFAADEDDHLDVTDFITGVEASVKQFGRMFFAKAMRDLEGTAAAEIVRILASDNSSEGMSHAELEGQGTVKELEGGIAQLEQAGLVKSPKKGHYKLSSRALKLYLVIPERSKLWREEMDKGSGVA